MKPLHKGISLRTISDSTMTVDMTAKTIFNKKERNMKPRITNQSYFIKRLKDSGYVVDRFFENYSEMDPRLWTVVIDPGGASVFCTLYNNRYSLGDFHFEFYDGGQFFGNRKIKTESVEVIVENLNSCGCIRKHDQYNQEGWRGLQEPEPTSTGS